MKPTAVRYPQSLTTFVTLDFARASTWHGAVGYALSMGLAAVALAGSFFHREITDTFGRELFGVRAVTCWQALLLVAALVWVTAMGLGVFCLPQKGRTRTFGAYSLGISVAAGLLA